MQQRYIHVRTTYVTIIIYSVPFPKERWENIECIMRRVHSCLLSSLLLIALTACGPTVSQWQATQNVSVNNAFQKEIPKLATIPRYLCGAWSSSNAPSPYSSINIYARLTQHTDQTVAPVMGAQAHAIIHYTYADAKLDQAPISDNGGYVTFYLQLQGQQPRLLAATVDILFKVQGKVVPCSHAFFTPQ